MNIFLENIQMQSGRAKYSQNDFQAGFLTSGSAYLLRLPVCIWQTVTLMQRSSPVTAAGPSRIYTGFPLSSLS